MSRLNSLLMNGLTQGSVKALTGQWYNAAFPPACPRYLP